MKLLNSLAALALLGGVALAPAAQAAGDHGVTNPPRVSWSFAGPFGSYDQAQLQRGFKVYREVCANCHQLKIPFRSLGEPGGPGFSAAQLKALAAEYKVKDGPNEAGEMFERPGRPSDYIPAPFPNPEAAKVANGGALPPEMSVLAKARTYSRGFPTFIFDAFTQYQEQGPDYIVALLNGYEEAPHGMVVEAGLNYNKYMPGNKIAMAKPLNDGQVDYTDGTPATVPQYARDVTAFLMWAAEPNLNQRKRMGFTVMAFLLVFAGLLYYTKKKIWASAH